MNVFDFISSKIDVETAVVLFERIWSSLRPETVDSLCEKVENATLQKVDAENCEFAKNLVAAGNGSRLADVASLAKMLEQNLTFTYGLLQETKDYTHETFDCISTLWTSDQQKAFFRETMTYIALIPAIFIIFLTGWLTVRKRLWPDKFKGRPGVPVPVNLVEEHRNRFTLIFTFCVFGMSMFHLLFDLMPFKWDVPTYLKSVMLVVAALMYGTIYYPFFAASTAKHPMVYFLVSIYTWAYTIVFIMVNLPCRNYDAYQMTAWFFQRFPVLCAQLFLSFVFPIRGFQIWCTHKKLTGDFLEDNKKLYQVIHVKRLLQLHKQKGKDEQARVLQIIKSRMYIPLPGFRFSSTILTSVILGLLIIYIMAVYLFLLIYRWGDDFIGPFRQAYETRNPFFILYSKHGILWKAFKWTRILLPRFHYIFLIDEAFFILDAVKGACYVALAIGFLMTTVSLIASLVTYRSLLLELYQGDHTHFPTRNKSPRAYLVSCTKFIGFQIGYAAWGFTIQCITIMAIFVAITILVIVVLRYKQTTIVIWALEKILPWLIYFILLLLTLHLLCHFVFLLSNRYGRRVLALNNRRLFFNFYYYSIFSNVPLGFLSALQRIIFSVVFGLWILPRLDMSTLNRRFETFDKGFSAYTALLTVENVQTNPVLLVFANLLQEAVRRLSVHGQIALRQWFTPKDGFRKTQVTLQEKLSWRLARNRWNLFVTLYNNPGLRPLRCHRLLLGPTPPDPQCTQRVIFDDISADPVDHFFEYQFHNPSFIPDFQPRSRENLNSAADTRNQNRNGYAISVIEIEP